MGMNRDTEGPTLEKLVVTLVQYEDSSGRSDVDHQAITIEVTDAGAGPYLVISTERWAIDDPVEFERQLSEIMDLARNWSGDTVQA